MDMHMKSISVDCNDNYYGFDKPIVLKEQIQALALKEGDAVIAYQDEYQWEGIVKYNPTLYERFQWYIELNEESKKDVPYERMMGRIEGEHSNAALLGRLAEKIDIARHMLMDGLDVNFVQKYTKLSTERIEELLYYINEAKKIAENK